jgi:hypothetical protein
MALTQEEYDELQRKFLEPQVRETTAALPAEAVEAERRARESAEQAAFDESLYMGGPQASREDVRRALEESEQRAGQRVEQAKQVVRQPGYETAPYEVPIGRSRLVVGTGGQVVDEEDGQLREASPFEQITEAVKRKRLAEADPFYEQIRMVREGEATREEVGLPQWVDVNVPTSGAGVEESVFSAGIRFLGALEPYVNEFRFGKSPLFDKEMLYYAMDEEGKPLDPEAPAYKAEELLKEYAPEYAAQGRMFPFLSYVPDVPKALADAGLPGASIGDALGPKATLALEVPRLFQGTTRHKGLQAASRSGDFVARVADAIAEGRSTGQEYVDLALYNRDMQREYGESVFGMPAAFAAGTIHSMPIPTPIGPLGHALKVPAKGVAAAAKAGSKVSRAKGLDTLADLMQPWETAKKLASRKAARDALGVDISDIRDPFEAPTLRSIAVDRAVSPVAAAVELKGVVTEALENGGKLNYDEMSRRFAGNESALGLLQRAFNEQTHLDPAGSVAKEGGEIMARALDDVVTSFVRAPQKKVLLDLLEEGKITTKQALKRIEEVFGQYTADMLADSTESELKYFLAQSLRADGMVPNTSNRFINSMYQMADNLMRGMHHADGGHLDYLAARLQEASKKGMGNEWRLFSDNLLRAVMEEAQAAGKDVARIVGAHAKKKMTPSRLRTMVEALGEGRGQVAIGNAFRETMITVGRDRIMQHLPDDYVFVSRQMLVPEKSAADARRAIDRMASQLFKVETAVSGKRVVPAAGNSIDDVIRVFVQEAGGISAGGRQGSRVGRSVLRKLKAGTPLDDEELDFFAKTMKDAIARNVVGSVQAVTEGAQTALGRNPVALRNALYSDAFSGMAVGRLARAARTSVAALHEVLPVAREAANGNAAASMMVSPSVSDGVTRESAGYFKKWYTALVRNPAVTLKEIISNPLYQFKPGTSVITEDYARKMADAVGSAADRMIGRLDELSKEGVEGPAAITRVVKEMNEEVDLLVDRQFRRKLLDHLESKAVGDRLGDDLSRAALIEEALLTARYMVKETKSIATDDKFKLGESVIDKMLVEIGLPGGIDDLRELEGDIAIDLLADAVVRATSIEENSKAWVSLMTTLMPGKNQLELLTKSSSLRPGNVNLTEAVKLAAAKGGAKIDDKGNLITDIGNTQLVLEVLVERNGPDVLKSTLQYSDVFSYWTSLTKKRPQAWAQGLQSWLVHQRAGLDASRLFTSMVDENPQMLLDFMPSNAQIARQAQSRAADVVITGLMDLERKLLGTEPDYDGYMNALGEASRVLAAGKDLSGQQLDPLARSIFYTLKQMEKMDSALKAEDRIMLSTAIQKQMAGGRGALPDLGHTGHALVQRLMEYESEYLKRLTPDEQITMGAEARAMSARYEVAANFQAHMANKAQASRVDLTLPEHVFFDRVQDLLYHGVLSGVEDSLLRPVHRQLDRMWLDAGVRFAAGDIPGLDGVIMSPRAVRPQFGPVHYMNVESGVNDALNRVEAAVASGRIQASLKDLSVRAELADKKTAFFPAQTMIALTAAKQLLQSTVRVVRSTMLAGGGVGLALAPNPLYHAGNVQSVPELLTATLGADLALKVLEKIPEGAKSAARNAQSMFIRKTITRAMAPVIDDADVVIKSPFYGDITAGELDELMDMTGIKFSRASIEAYESIGQQMAQAAKLNLRGDPRVKAGPATQFMRLFNPAGMNEWMKFAEDTDGVTRRAAFIAGLANGYTIEQSAALARESLLDYGKVAASGNVASQFMQKWTMYWAFRRQSLIMTLNNMADGKFGRQEMMGRWIRLQSRQKQGASPEEFLFGPDYIKLRMYLTPGVDDVGFTAGAPSVLSEGASDFLGWMTTIGVGFDAVVGDGKFENFFGMLMDNIQQENLDLLSTTAAELFNMAGRMDDRGPLVSDVLMAQLLGFDAATGANVFPVVRSYFELEVDKDPETGMPVVTQGRPYLQSEGEIVQRAHQYRFKNNKGYMKYLLFRTLLAATSLARTGDEWTKIALTLEPLVPEGFHPEYRALAGTISYMTRTATPMRTADKDEQRARVQRQQQRRVQRAGK